MTDPNSPYAFVGGTLIDGTGAPPIPDSAVVVDGGRIRWAGPAADLRSEADVRLVDAVSKYLVPGLLDGNVHLVMHLDPEIVFKYDPGCYDELVVEAAQVALRAGITTVFDTWGPLEALRRVRDRIDKGEITGSRIFFAGNIIGNGGPWSDDFPLNPGSSLSKTTVEDINRHWEVGVGAELTWMSADDVQVAVREYVATSGIDFVKYSSSAHAHGRFLAFSPDAQCAIVDEAHAAGMTAQACTLTPEALKVAIQSGVDLLQHVDITCRREIPQETLDMIVERQIPCVAFLDTEGYLAAEGGSLYGDNAPVKDANARRLISSGAKLMLGHDASLFGASAESSPLYGPLVAGIEAPWELGTMHPLWLKAAIERGMTPMDALLAATRNIAEAYGKLSELGTIEPGKRADLLVLDANPLDQPENYTRIAHVVKDGEIVDRERLPEDPVLTAPAAAANGET